MKILLTALIVVIAALAALFLLGPRDRVKPFAAPDASHLDGDIDAILSEAEARFPDIREGLHKEIIWRDASVRSRTSTAIVYIHGFSASKPETRPLPDMVAEALDANIFYTRLTGHGRTGAAMAEARANDWLNDTAEAIEIGRRIGDRVLVMATSTGATAAVFGALDPSLRKDIAGMAFISPNFGVQAAGSEYLTVPWGRHLVQLFLGRERDFTGDNAAYNHGWTTRYPMESLVPMMALVQAARKLPFEQATTPLLVLQAPDDRVVNPLESRKVFNRWSGPKEWIDVGGTRGENHHVIAGDIVNPDMTAPLAAKMVEWARGLNSAEGSQTSSR